ncbi:MAG: hypothetical protein ABR542_09460, partial [Desulfonatronovibrio sp.]
YGRAELATLKAFTEEMGIDLVESMELMRDAGIQVEDERQTLLDIAHQNNTSPQQLYELMQQKDDIGAVGIMPEEPESGFGNLHLIDVCRAYGLDISVVLNGLAEKSISATEDATIKEIAAKNGIEPVDVFTAIKGISTPN